MFYNNSPLKKLNKIDTCNQDHPNSSGKSGIYFLIEILLKYVYSLKQLSRDSYGNEFKLIYLKVNAEGTHADFFSLETVLRKASKFSPP